jgi:adenine phosphoribosyltransferase
MILRDKIDAAIRTIPDFPKPGIMFKDITPILRDPVLVHQIAQEIARQFKGLGVEVVAGIESRGFLFGMLVAQELNCSFAIIRKKGKLPHKTVEMEYALEYGSAIIEMHEDEIKAGQKVMIHDDLLATGGTASAASKLVGQVGGKIVGFSFVIGLDFLGGKKLIEQQSSKIVTLINY